MRDSVVISPVWPRTTCERFEEGPGCRLIHMTRKYSVRKCVDFAHTCTNLERLRRFRRQRHHLASGCGRPLPYARHTSLGVGRSCDTQVGENGSVAGTAAP